MMIILLVVFFVIRLIFLAHSIRQEKRLIAKGAVQYGKTNSTILALAHTAYYFALFITVLLQKPIFNTVSFIGALLTTLSFIVLLYIVKSLGEIWTVKIYILPNHQINQTWLFKTFKHPNYFLNIIPELIGIGLLCQAWWVMIIGLPIYLLVLGIRIYQEELAMKGLFGRV